MDRRSIDAYDLPQRVASYDANMELMHPNRSKMVQIALEVLPFPNNGPLRAVDVGIGTGYFTEQFLARHPQSRVVGVDGARAMIDLAQARLGERADRVDFRIGDFRRLQALVGEDGFDVVYSAYALHHLNRDDKQSVVAQALELLRPGGWFLNADLIVAGSEAVERRLQEIRVAGILERAGGRDARFVDAAATGRFLDEMEANEGDQPLTLAADLTVLAQAGLRDASVFWVEYREMVSGGRR
jgi:tRNA (cmo5U34)-methyltransferase